MSKHISSKLRMKKTFFLMRHAQTYENAKIEVEEDQRFELTEVGKSQAKKVGDYLKTIPFDHYYTSTLSRTQETLKLALGEEISYQEIHGLNELETGKGESRTQVAKRMKQTCIELMEKEQHHTVLAVSHAGASYSFLKNWLNKEELRKIRKDGIVNTIIFKFDYQNQTFQLAEIIRPED